ncbi:MAG: aminotransferase class V-fold PLP-dependent enzyme [Acidobacteriota bacterium]
MIYLDNNATTQLAPSVRAAMLPFLDVSYGNPSSAHAGGRDARRAVEAARESVAGLLGTDRAEIVFTSGGTESDNWAIRGALAASPEKKHIVTSRVEHEAVRKLCEKLGLEGYEVSLLDVDEDGALDLSQVREFVRSDTAVVSVMLANNETGILFPVDEIAEIVKQRSDALMHVDGVNAVGKVPIDLSKTAIDLFSVAAHKFHGPKGVGALYIRDGVTLQSLSIGGGQESGRRAGTEAVHQIVGMGAAAEFVRDMSATHKVRRLRDKLEKEILQNISVASLNGTSDESRRLPNTSNVSFENLNGEAIMARLDDAGICVSTGSACNARDHVASAVLAAMDIPYAKAMGSIRFSLGRFNIEEEIATVPAEVERIIADLRSFG